MPNMSYCRFQNTLADLRECKEAMDEGALSFATRHKGGLSAAEGLAADELIALCKEIAEEFGE